MVRLTRAKSPGLDPPPSAFDGLRRTKPHQWGCRDRGQWRCHVRLIASNQLWDDNQICTICATCGYRRFCCRGQTMSIINVFNRRRVGGALSFTVLRLKGKVRRTISA